MNLAQVKEHIIYVLDEYMDVKAKLLYFAMFFKEENERFYFDPVEYQALSGADSLQQLNYLLYVLSEEHGLIDIFLDDDKERHIQFKHI